MAPTKGKKPKTFTKRTPTGAFVAEHKRKLYFVDENLLEEYHHYEGGDDHDGWFAEHDDPDAVCEFGPETDRKEENDVPWDFNSPTAMTRRSQPRT